MTTRWMKVLHRRLAGTALALGVVLGALIAPGLLIGALLAPVPAHAEYGDVVMNNYSDAAGMRPVVFPHWFHRIRYRCKVCHADLGFKFKAGGNEVNMLKVIDGQFCGACHNGDVAWSIENCNMCHSAKPGTPTQVHESTTQALVVRTPAPAASAPARATK
jgi:c(7)-type cytochrome triheme protein